MRAADTGTAATTYTDDTVAAGTTYTYRIKAINGGVTSAPAGSTTPRRRPYPPSPRASPPRRPTTRSPGTRQDDSITGYVILRRIRENDQGGEFSELVADTGTAATTYTDDTVEASTHYTYRIKAINEYGVSERSRWFHIDTPAAP